MLAVIDGYVVVEEGEVGVLEARHVVLEERTR